MNSDGIEQAAEKYLRKYLFLESDEPTNDITIPFDKVVKLMCGKEWQQSQPDHTQSEIIAGYIHEIDSLRETNRKLGEQIKSQTEIPEDIELEKQIAWEAWQSAANAHRMYPDNKHTFTDYWANIGKDKAKAALNQKGNTDLPEQDSEKIKEDGEITYKVMLRQSSTRRDSKGNVIIPESDLLEWFCTGSHLRKYTSWDTM